ncbi:lipid-A-disaccharide synthase [Lichenibacterium ramalinae]|uniref:Lipid-A-disaccharide synthase n=1 Tax=Lichenibacterium ramalinae TaxID=2316527 RepID=A0A4Q2RGN6_9HYPH|nr:lipid-A-disaccharide synthase [Lichenibacterium ramalinae]RYB05700.1 lipid-A-disaccharide synthase [Lichenibacterium ramalinae]
MTGAGAPRSLRVFIVAGEHSGDHLGAGLIRALRERVPGLAVSGVGGDEMAREGLVPLFPLSDIAVMGFVPVIARLPHLLRRIRETAAAAVAARPDVLVIVDSPDFTHRVARRVRALAPGVPIVDYVSPTVWAWRPGRAPAMRAYVDRLLALLPFEPEAHRRLGGPPCSYVGHPLIERLHELRPAPADLPARERATLLVLPGSRRSEIRRLTQVFGETVARVAGRVPDLDVVLPAVADLAGDIRARVASWPVQPRVVTGEAAKLAAFRSARAALAASGTVTLELALAGVPMVVAYRVSPLETWLRFVVTVPSIVLPNLILGENAVPEFLQGACRPDALAASLVPLLGDSPARAAQLDAFGRLDALMRIASGSTPSREAAALVLDAAGTSA